MDVPVEELAAGRKLVLLSGKAVRVESATTDADGVTTVRWRAGAMYRSPHKLAGQHEDLGSFLPRRAGETVSVAGIELIKTDA